MSTVDQTSGLEDLFILSISLNGIVMLRWIGPSPALVPPQKFFGDIVMVSVEKNE